MAPRRRDLLLASAALLTGAAAPDAPARAREWITAWDSQGIHRTATPGDEAGAGWLAREASAIGGAVTIEDWKLDRIDPVSAFVELDGNRLTGEKLFDAPDTPRGGVSGAVGPDPGDGFIAAARYGPLAVYAPDFVRFRRESRQRALIIVTSGERPGLAQFNAESFTAPFGPAAILLPSTAGEALFAAFARGAGCRVAVHSRRTPAVARNVVVTLRGRDSTRSPVVVMTPRSSWWQSTSERGGGLVCGLEALRALVAEPPACDVVFVASSGHELGHIGLDDFIRRRPDWQKSALWLHFGANIGATGGRLTLQSPWPDLRELASRAMSDAGQPLDALSPPDTVPAGESRDIHRAGGRYVTLVGSNALFHLPDDRWPDAVDLGVVTRSAAAFARVAVALTR
jgi:hypothetical protein